jgi:phosphatidate cytidylyltransferase
MGLRIIPTLLFVPVLIYTVFSKYTILFLLLITGVIIAGLIEITLLSERCGARPFRILSIILGISLILIAYFKPENYHMLSALVLIPFWMLFICGIIIKNGYLKRLGSTLSGVIYVSYLLSHLVLIKYLIDGSFVLFLLFMVVWFSDTGAYIIGTRFGQHQLSPHISPKKSVEGAIAGCITGIITAIISCKIGEYWFDNVDVGLIEAGIIGFSLSIIGQISDLIESGIKRVAMVKDSGRWIPGHGGVLDVFDSIILTAPFVYYWYAYWRS